MKLKIITLILCCFSYVSLLAQSKISGKVTDESSQPLPGVSILIEGTTTGVTTDFDGKYEVNVEQGQVLLFSYIGFIGQEVTIQNQTVLNVILKENLEQLDDVVVIGYGTAKKTDLTGSVASISSDDFAQGNMGTVQNLIAGKAPGVRIYSSAGAEPGAESSIQIRGANSISGNNNPLYVIDGFPAPDSFSMGTDINPNDVETIDVLKDASATAIYGSRAANGVIMITTKRAKSEKSKITFSAIGGIQELVKPIEFANAGTLGQIVNEGLIFNGNEPLYSDEELLELDENTTDWLELGTQLGSFQDYSLGIYSGGKTSNFNVNFGYYNNEGVVKETNFDRMTTALNYSKDFSDKFSITGTVKLSNIKSSFRGFSAGGGRESVLNRLLGTSPLFKAYNEDGSYGDAPEGSTQENPLPAILEVTNDLKRNSMYSNVSLKYDFTDNFDVQINAGGLVQNSFTGTYLPKNTPAGGFVGGQAEVTNHNVRNYLVEGFLNYNLKVKNNTTTFLIGVSQQNDYTIANKIVAKDFNSDAYLYHNLSAANVIDTPISSYVTTKRQSAFFRLNNTYLNKYIVTATLRADASSRFGTNNKTGYFPSVAFAWKTSNENFLKNSNTISNLKIRGSYGVTGNDRIPAGRSTALSGTDWSTYAWNGAGGRVGISPVNLPNPDLKWETTKQFNIGFELGLLNNRINIEADFYDKTTDDLLFTRDINGYLGLDNFLENIGSVRNSGFEFSIDADLIRTKDFKWNSNFNISYNKNEVLSLPEGNETLALRDFVGGFNEYHKLQVGLPMSAFFGYKVDRILQEGETSDLQPALVEGQYTFQDTDDDGDIDDDDRVYLGSGLPDYIFGFTNTFQYKNLSLSALFTGSINQVGFNINRSSFESRYWKTAEDRWTLSNPDTDIPKEFGWANSSIANDRYLEDASYIRLQNVTLSYKIPTQGIGLNDLRIAITGENLAVFTKYTGFDPDLSASSDPTKVGLDYNGYPQNRIFSMSLKATF
ncbi:SusC/RagA family TonB-linked outer membrane protein [Algibacter mikhailovii]|uniref:SusC/RagA family TonB-linked outer membrane protein n=1 Tax=Algibacter mikhailovii TaxID=425498 RepID=UPI0024957451|nr:TonB-dependent receptor [Algibacter mikhailovii]